MAKQKIIKEPLYTAGKTVNGYGVYNTKTMEQLYYSPFSGTISENVDREVAFLKIAGLLNVTESPAADERLIETINQQLQEFAKYKCHD